MLKKTLLVSGFTLVCLAAALPLLAQEPATLVLRSGERISGELVDLGGAGFTLRVSGQERQIDTGQVAAIEFVGGAPNANVRQRLEDGRSIVVLRSGEVIEGSLTDIGGTRPLRVTVSTPGGQRDFNSSEVAQIFYGGPSAVATSGQTAAREAAPGEFRVEANRAWTDTGITVRRGERLTVNPDGNVNLAPGISAGVNGTSAVSSATYPVRNAPAGALIARVGNSAPFLVGSQTSIVAPANGRLYFGVNDDNHADNNGFFTVGVAPATAQRLR
jgi:hypothetical protein